MPDLLTTTKAALFLKEQRGIIVKADTVKHWCLQGRFPNAERCTDGGGRGYWLISEDDLLTFAPPVTGRPPRKKEQNKAPGSL